MVDRSELWLGRHVDVRLCGGETVGAVVDGLCNDWVGVRLDRGGYVIADWEDIEVDAEPEVVNDLREGNVRAVRLPDGRYVTEKLARELEEEIQGERMKLIEAFGPMNGEQVIAIKDFARHFAKLGAEHTPLPEDTVLFLKGVEEGKRLMMEEMSECFAQLEQAQFESINMPAVREQLAYNRGASDERYKMRKKIMEEAVEGEVVQDLKGVNRVKSLGKIPEGLHFGDKVRIIIVKED